MSHASDLIATDIDAYHSELKSAGVDVDAEGAS